MTTQTARLEAFQTTQLVEDGCHALQYTVYSTKSNEQIKLYADGPCRDVGQSIVTINVTILPCPNGFIEMQDFCDCETRLQKFDITCVIKNIPLFVKKANFWMKALYKNGTYKGLILALSCPHEYCNSKLVHFTLEDYDSQCNQNRVGLVCGSCAVKHSLTLGGSSCQICSNTHLALILPFALMGVTLLVFMTFLRITVTAGVVNSIILYSNILQTIKYSLLPSNVQNVLTVFLAWMNLDFGFQTCFYDGMDAYMQTWLQFVFPLYVWLLIGAIILISRYSITVSKLIGHNPIAVLATLILMSYMKILKIIVEVYLFVELEYPDNKTVTAWLKDPNVPYLKSAHLALTTVTTVVLVFFFLPYTVLLLIGHKLYRFTGNRYFGWFGRVKPLLESYYAPYKVNTRFWTGLLLLVRCALYIMFLRFSQSTNKTFMATVLTFCALGFVLGIVYKGRIYKSVTVNIAEVFVYMNIITLSATAQAGLNSKTLVHLLCALVFLQFLGTCMYQFHCLYIAKTTLWVKMTEKVTKCLPQKHHKPVEQVTVNPSQDPHRIVTKTVIELREPLIDIIN